MEPKSEAGPRVGVWGPKAATRLHGLHPRGQSKESCLRFTWFSTRWYAFFL